VADKLDGVRLPTLIIHGELDAIIPLASAEMASQAIPGSKLVVIRGAGHVPVITRPEQVVAAIDDWWREAAT
jgi:3-oxoadipate enol-lactonase